MNISKKSDISDFLFAGKKLQTSAIVSLLISTSFGLNAIFYAAWLGYSIGIWALVIQIAWSISFFLLIPASKHFSHIASLHDFLGQQFGQKTKLLASVCSLVGICYFIVWEVSISIETIAPLTSNAPTVIGFFALVAITYTSFFGLRGNAYINRYINFVKVVILFGMSGFALYHFSQLPSELIYQSVFPSFDTVVKNLGMLGLITNIIFNLAWQFVDNSSWQSIIGGSKTSHISTSVNLKYSGLLIFLTVNLTSTFLGISLAQVHTVTPDNILSMTSVVMPQYSTLISTGIIVLSIASMMTLVDGMLLASALTVNIDILPASWMAQLSEKKRMTFIQLSIIVFGLLTIWGIQFLLDAFEVNMFDFLYIIVISQLSLIGPVIVGLYTKSKKIKYMWLPIIVALIVGFGSIIIGGMTGTKGLIDGAGTFSVITSCIAAWAACYLHKYI
ncbi:hypothetical protein KBC70_00300 [Candidatus Woesebacteria bacterium]|nr:hypothetical protein [Candidatus Woesebacteria bacterium]